VVADQPRLVLGSASPRRADLLKQLGVAFTVEVVPIDEDELFDAALSASDTAARIAQAKFAAFAPMHDDPILLTADTVVTANGATMGKPLSPKHLHEMLTAMSGQHVQITTAVCLGTAGTDPDTDTVSTSVALRDLTADEINRYVQTGIGMDKAGGLALQSRARPFIASVDGCWSNVLGLPVCQVHARFNPPIEREQACRPSRCGTASSE